MIDALTGQPQLASRMYKSIMRLCKRSDGSTDSAHVLMILAGVLTEVSLSFNNPDDAACWMLEDLSRVLDVKPTAGKLGFSALPPPSLIDQNAEKGRALVRDIIVDWEGNVFDFHDFLRNVIYSVFVSWDNEDFRKADMLRLLSECLYRALSYEFTAQELCDSVIEQKAESQKWQLSHCVSALGALAGHKQATMMRSEGHLSGQFMFDQIDALIHTMTQEAVRLGVPAGSDWRFGLAANDVPVSAPHDLIEDLTPICDSFFRAIQMKNLSDQATACAKAAGRMLAITSGGDMPEIEPIIAKPLVVSAISDTFKSICMHKMHIA